MRANRVQATVCRMGRKGLSDQILVFRRRSVNRRTGTMPSENGMLEEDCAAFYTIRK